MKKGESNFEQWNRRIGYALTLLVLIDCIVPFTWNAWRQRPIAGGRIQDRSRGQSFAMSLVESLGKIANSKNSWPSNEFGLEHGFEENGWKNEFGLSGSNKRSGVQIPNEEMFRRNLTVFILPDLRRTATGNENVAAVASNQELSLQDSDAIDFYWRQDIDAEKGNYPNLWSPDLQYERDVQLVTEKTLLQPVQTDQHFRYLTNQPSDFLRDLISAQKDYFGSETYQTFDDPKTGGWQSEKTPLVYHSATTTQQEQPSNVDNAYGGESSNQNSSLDWFNSTTLDPMNDVYLDTNQLLNGEYNVNQGQPNSEYNFLQNNELNTPPASMDWESRPVAQSNINYEENRADPMLSALFSASDLDNLPTPDLFLAPNDAASLFGNRQVVQDVQDAQTTKEMLLHHSPIAAVDAFPSTSGADLMTFGPASVYDENYLGDGERSEVVIETIPPYDNPYAANTWHQTAPVMSTWHPQPPADLSAAATSVSPTWSGDHDYTMELPTGEQQEQFAAAGWTIGDEMTVKSEAAESFYGEDDEEDDPEEDSSEQRARAASERDEIRARQLNLPFTAAEIVKLTQSEYVTLTRSKNRFTREQLELIKEIRRHGGNKEAARRSRQKKFQMSKQLEDEVHILERERDAVMMEYKKMLREVENEEKAIEQLKKNLRK